MQSTNGFEPIKTMGKFSALLIAFLLWIGFCFLLKPFPGASVDAAQSISQWNRVGSLGAGRFLHTATLLQNGKVLIAGGIGAGASGTMALSSAELYDPATGTWSRTGSLSTTRFYHTALLLTNGKVLVAGGASRLDPNGAFATPLDSAEIYDPATGAWSPAGNFSTARGTHTATLLRDGRVLIAGGALVNVDSTASAQIYDPQTGAWSATGNLNTARSAHVAALLTDGRVLVAGGLGNNTVLASVEIYDPATGRWTPAASLNTARFHFSATGLPDGQVLVVGGGGDLDFDIFRSLALASAELYNPMTGSWTAAGNLTTQRGHHTATLLPNGQVLVSGGFIGQAVSTNSAEIYDPASRQWIFAPQLSTGRFWHTVTLLPGGQALSVGGVDLFTGVKDGAEVFDPIANAGAWRPTGSLGVLRTFSSNAVLPDHTATLLPDGRVLVVGGAQPAGALNAVELYDPSSGTWSLAVRSLTEPRRQHTATLLSNGKVLLAGGINRLGLTTNTAEVYDLGGGGMRTANDLSLASRLHTATLLADGRVLIAGGETESSLARAFGARVAARTVPTAVALGRAELYDPAANRWNVTSSLAQARSGHTAVLLPNRKILVAGGSDRNNVAIASGELYDPVTGTWSATGSLNRARRLHTATLLPSGKVLVVGGEVSPGTLTNSVEIYDPDTGAWSAGGNLTVARFQHTATLLLNGQILVAGGSDAGTSIRTWEIYDPGLNQWELGAVINPARHLHTATLLQTGMVMIVGGVEGTSITTGALPLDSAQLFEAGSPILRKPSISGAPASLANGGNLTVTGSGFTGGPEASSGNAQSSASNYPLLQLRSLANDQTRFLLPDPSSNWSDTAFTSQAVLGFPRGQALVSVVSNGIASDARSLLIGCAAITLSPAALPDGTLCAPYSQTITASGGTPPYTFNSPANRLPPGLQLVGDRLFGTPTQPGQFLVSIFGTDVYGCAFVLDLPLTVNPSSVSVRPAPSMASFAETDPQRRPTLTLSSPTSQSSLCFLIENTNCFILRLRLESFVRTNGERISDPNDLRSSSPTLYERNPYLLKQSLSPGVDIPITPSSMITIVPGGQTRLCVQFDPVVPGRAGRTSALAANQVMPEQITSQLNFLADSPVGAGGVPSRLSIPINASLNPLLKLIHPSDPSLPPLVTLARAGDEFTVNLAVYDPNMDLNLIRYQFLDSAGNQVDSNVDVEITEAIQRAGLVRGQSFGVTQRFQGASNRSEVSSVRVIVFDRTGEESAVSVPATGFNSGANSRLAQPHAQGLTLELPVRTLAPRRSADVRRPQPATLRRRD